MNHFIVNVRVTEGERQYNEHLLLEVLPEGDELIEQTVERIAYLVVQRGPELEPSDSGFFDLGGEIHLEVTSIQEVSPEHLPILEHYLDGRPLPEQPEAWHVSWEIDLDKSEAETARDAAVVASCYALAQFSKMAGMDAPLSKPVTKPALTVNGQLIDFEQNHQNS